MGNVQHIDTAMIIGCYLAIIGLYIWVFKKLQEITNMQHRHETEANKHVKSEDLVFRDVCQVQVKRFEERISEVKVELGEVKSDIRTGFHEIKELLKAN